MTNFIANNKVLIGILLTAVISGISAITGLVSPQTATWLTLVLSALTGIGHSANILKGVK